MNLNNRVMIRKYPKEKFITKGKRQKLILKRKVVHDKVAQNKENEWGKISFKLKKRPKNSCFNYFIIIYIFI